MISWWHVVGKSVARAALALLLVCTGSPRVGAQPARRVVLLEPATPTAEEDELATRLEGELHAAGVQVLGVKRLPGSDAENAAAARGRELHPVAIFAIGRREGGLGAEEDPSSRLQLWFSDRLGTALLVASGMDGHVGSEAAKLLAIQGVEFLRARFANWPSPEPPAAPREAPVIPSPAPRRSDARLTPMVALGVLVENDPLRVAPTPLLRIAYTRGVHPRGGSSLEWGVRLSVAGLGAATVLPASLGQVKIDQSFAVLEGLASLYSRSWLQPFVTVGGGAYRVSVQGVGGEQAIGRASQTGSPVGAASVGLSAHPFGALVGVMEAQGLFALRPTVVRVDSAELASLGRPLVVLAVGIGVSL